MLANILTIRSVPLALYSINLRFSCNSLGMSFSDTCPDLLTSGGLDAPGVAGEEAGLLSAGLDVVVFCCFGLESGGVVLPVVVGGACGVAVFGCDEAGFQLAGGFLTLAMTSALYLAGTSSILFLPMKIL